MVDTSPKATGITEPPPTAVMGTYNRYPLTLVRGKGCWVRDHKGHRYLDAVAGIATCTLGHSNPALRRALKDQLSRLQLIEGRFRVKNSHIRPRTIATKGTFDG